MAETRRLAALKAFESTLDGGSKPAGLTFTRFAFRTVEKRHLPVGIIAHGGGLRVDTEVNNLTENTDLFRLAVRVEASQSLEPDDVIDPYLSYVLSTLEADRTLGGVVNTITLRPLGPTVVDEADVVYVQVIQDIEVQYYHRRTDPETQI